jgi:uncharacterized protein HemX
MDNWGKVHRETSESCQTPINRDICAGQADSASTIAVYPDWVEWVFATLSISLAAIPVVLAVAGIAAFIHFRRVAKKQATAVAREEAVKAAKTEANRYLQENLGDIVDEYMELMRNSDGNADSNADQIAKSQAEDDINENS